MRTISITIGIQIRSQQGLALHARKLFNLSKEAAITISEEEPAKWKDIAENMYFPVDEELGIFVQHDILR